MAEGTYGERISPTGRQGVEERPVEGGLGPDHRGGDGVEGEE